MGILSSYVFMFRGEGDGVKERLSRHTTKKEILLFADALRIFKGQLVISPCES